MRLLLLILLTLITSAYCESPSYETVAVVQSPEIDENSGIDLSYKYPNALWTHNDSGGKPNLYLLSLSTGKTLATISIEGSMNRDWEDISTYQKDGKSYIIVGDTGDNLRIYGEYQLCIFEEPDLDISGDGEAVVPVKEWIDLRFHYEDGARNCESIGVDLEKNQVIIFEKTYGEVSGKSGVYCLDIPEKTIADGKARRICSLPAKMFSALDISDDGLTLIARAYHAGYLFRRTPGQTWTEILSKAMPTPFEFPLQKQGEGVCFTPDGKSVLVSTEKKKQPIYKVKLPGGM